MPSPSPGSTINMCKCCLLSKKTQPVIQVLHLYCGVLQGSFGKVTNVVRNMWLEDYQFSPVPSCTSRQAPVDLGSQLSYYDVQVDKPRREGSFQVLIA